MKTYRISPTLAEVEHKRSLMHSSAFIAVVMVAVLLFGGLLKNLDNDLSFILYSVVSMGLLIAFALLNSIRSFELVVDESSIKRRGLSALSLIRDAGVHLSRPCRDLVEFLNSFTRHCVPGYFQSRLKALGDSAQIPGVCASTQWSLPKGVVR